MGSASLTFSSTITIEPRPTLLQRLKTAFLTRTFRGTEISKISTKITMLLRRKEKIPEYICNESSTTDSSDDSSASDSEYDFQMISHTMTIKELLIMWSWVPLRITMYQPILLFTTEEHGCSLSTFYNRVEYHGPTILLITTTNDEIFGAYLSAPWSTRHESGQVHRYFGTGETFLFTLWPERVKYPWVGIKSHGQSSTKIDHSAELFMHGDSHMITIGGGQDITHLVLLDGQGIYLDGDLRYGKTEKCLTFNNPPLVPTIDFEVRTLEVFGFSFV